jgi:hypothetical protein
MKVRGKNVNYKITEDLLNTFSIELNKELDLINVI